MTDILSRADLELLMANFYERLLQDDRISYIFTDVAEIDLVTHLPQITDFWEQVMFGTGGYRKNVLQIHLDLNEKSQFTDLHFETWLSHLYETVDTNFKGENAEKLKTRALSVATVMRFKMFGSERLQ